MYPVTERVQTNCGISPSSAVERFESEFGIVSERASTEFLCSSAAPSSRMRLEFSSEEFLQSHLPRVS